MNPSQSRPARALFLYFIITILLGALLAPWIYWLVQWLATNVAGFDWLQRHPFKRVFNRSVMVIALIGLWPLLKNVGIRSWSAIGFVRRRDWFRQFLLGYFLGMLSISLAVVIAMTFGRSDLILDPSLPELAGLLCKFLVVGLVVALIEETFFRGALQSILGTGLSKTAALVTTSVLYSAVHFLKPKGVRILPEDVTAWSGFACIGHIFSKSLATEGVLVGFITLFLAGLILGWAFNRTRALYVSIGLHAGWVLINELVRSLGSRQIIEVWLTWPALLMLWIVLWKMLPVQVGDSRNNLPN